MSIGGLPVALAALADVFAFALACWAPNAPILVVIVVGPETLLALALARALVLACAFAPHAGCSARWGARTRGGVHGGAEACEGNGVSTICFGPVSTEQTIKQVS